MKKIIALSYIFSFALLSCGGGGDDNTGGGDDGDDDTPPTAAAPKAATLVFPDANTECNEGVVINDAQSEVDFKWDASADTDSYEVNILNLNTNQTKKSNSTTNSKVIAIDRGTPYEWFVISKATGTTETATSAKRRFYNQGAGVENYAPFPAEVVNPERGTTIATTTSVALEWTASDVDNDIESYEILFGTSTEPTTSLGTTTTNTMDATVASGSVYYWRVITTDSQGNSSDSEIFEFGVN